MFTILTLPLAAWIAALIQSPGNDVPYRQPQLAAAHGQVAMVFGSGPTIYFSASSDQGRSFDPPVRVGEAAGLMLGRHRGPRLAILPNALLVSAITSQPAGQGDLITWRSTDHGRTWKRSAVVNDVPAAAREGLHAMVADSKGNVFAAWLDLRSKGTRLYGARSTDGGLSWSKNVLVYESPSGTICQCCDPSLAVDQDGRIFAMWRNVVDGSRDLYVSSSIDGEHFGSAQKMGTNSWKLNACPMDGGGLVAGTGELVSAWRRDSNVFLAESGQAEKQIGTGKDVSIAKGKAGVYVAWTAGGNAEVLAPKSASPVLLGDGGAYVNLASLPDGAVLAAWESHGRIETKRLE